VTRENAWTTLEEGIVAAVTPSFGQAGTSVTISGNRLLGGGTKAVSVSLASQYAEISGDGTDTEIVVRASSSEAKVGDVVITSDTGSIVTKKDGFAYKDRGQVVDLKPVDGQYGTVVTLTGTNLLGSGGNVSEVTLAGRKAIRVIYQSNTEIRVVANHAGANLTKGPASILMDSGAVVTGASTFEYRAAGVISSVVPSIGQRGTKITVRGERLRGSGPEVQQVKLGNTPATILEQNDNVVVIQALAAKSEDVDVVLIPRRAPWLRAKTDLPTLPREWWKSSARLTVTMVQG
jgi:hypothetical protein